MAEPLLRVQGLTKRFGALAASDGLTLSVAAGEVHGLIGPNGAGKTTAIRQIFGEMTPDAGRIVFDGRDITRLSTPLRARLGLVRSYQITSLFAEFTVLENAALAVQAQSGSPLALFSRVAGDERLCAGARAVLDEVGLANKAHLPVTQLGHGEQRQLELAMVLAGRPRLMLLDEPMAGMAPAESERMAALLGRLKGRAAMVLVEHDMDVVFGLADRITVLVSGRALATGTPAEIRADAAVRTAYLGDG